MRNKYTINKLKCIIKNIYVIKSNHNYKELRFDPLL